MGFDDTGLGEAMTIAEARDAGNDAKAIARKLSRRVEDLEQRVTEQDLQISNLLDACRFLYRYYVDNETSGTWPLKPKN